jgi:predicted acylesterase/phospholipase RssA
MSTPANQYNPTTLARRILRNESPEMVLEDNLVREIFAAELEGLDAEESPATFMKLFWLAMCLKTVKQFEYARKILFRAQRLAVEENAAQEWLIKIIQQRSLCTYKDAYLPPDERLNTALAVLKELRPLQPVPDQETLGLKGGIYKRKWEADGNKQHLEVSLSYYRQSYELGMGNGYGAINAAYVLDLLANLELEEATETGSQYLRAEERIEEAQAIRRAVKAALDKMVEESPEYAGEWWFLSTRAEADFGREEFDEAARWLEKAKSLRESQRNVAVCANKVPDWQLEATARQFAMLARIRERNASLLAKLRKRSESKAAGVVSAVPAEEESQPAAISRKAMKSSRAWEVLREFLGSDAGVETAYIGKVGLALSGGGFRASLFHIGVLAKLAELDVLRHVEVLSCVSGGSIIGAHYYLEVRKLLQEKSSEEITREHYLEIVKRIEREFLEGVKSNIRTRIASNPLVNLKMFWNHAYSRTERAGELYEQELYAKVKDGEGDKPRVLRKLIIKPLGEEAFSPKLHNWRRRAKAPILIINATTLNTGHNWHFTASYMGESPASIIPEIDGNCRLRRMYYEDEAPERHRDITLGRAVAASACVPGLFEPIVLEELYQPLTDGDASKPQDITVRLVDGGVHDNQGVSGLLEQDCTVLLVSDASGQMRTEPAPSASLLGVPLRSNNILMARVREAEYRELAARRRSSLLSGLMYIHLRKDINVNPVDWLNCKDRYEDSDEYKEMQQRSRQWTSYGISKKVQERLSLVRTDLDAFSEIEAYALMASGYRMTEHEFPLSLRNIPTSTVKEDWQFLQVDPLLREESSEAAQKEFTRLLDVGQKLGFKLWYLNSTLRWLGFGFKLFGVLAVLAAVAMLLLIFRDPDLISRGSRIAASTILGGITLLILLAIVLGRLNFKQARRAELLLIRIIIGLIFGPLVWLGAGLYLLLFNKRFINRGSLKYIRGLEGKAV